MTRKPKPPVGWDIARRPFNWTDALRRPCRPAPGSEASFCQYLDEVERIADEAAYLKSMEKSYGDKLWFVNRIPRGTDAFVDFGGSDGGFCDLVMRKAANGDRMKFVVIDFNQTYLDAARSRGFYGFEDLEEFMAQKDDFGIRRPMLNLSSVIHEVYSYASEGRGVAGFWDLVGRCGFRAIAVRDMYFDEARSASLGQDVAEWIYRNVLLDPDAEVRGKKLKWLVLTFEEVWGPIFAPGQGVNAKNLVHFLYKYRYGQNWARELRENYLPVGVQELKSEIASRAGCPKIHEEFTQLPFLVKTWKKDFQLDKPSPGRVREKFANWLAGLKTHVKLLATR